MEFNNIKNKLSKISLWKGEYNKGILTDCNSKVRLFSRGYIEEEFIKSSDFLSNLRAEIDDEILKCKKNQKKRVKKKSLSNALRCNVFLVN